MNEAKKIVHVMIASFFKEGYGYQENIITKKHVELGYDVSIITYDRFGLFREIFDGEESGDYINQYGVHVYVLPKNRSIIKRVPILMFCAPYTIGFYALLSKLEPDIIFVHSIQSQESLQILRYKKKHSNVRLFFDHHADYYNTPVTTVPQKIVHYGLFREYARKLMPYTEMFWAVSPWRLDYLRKVYGVKESKSQLLVMGGDEELIDWSHRLEIRKDVRIRYKIPEEAFLVITGGKISVEKNVHVLYNCIKGMSNVYLLIFGRIEKDAEPLFDFSQEDNIRYAGWLSPEETYQFFLASDLAVFPGTHSVLWEQACACGIPAIFKDWSGGFNHVDVGGNCIMLDKITEESLRQAINFIMSNESVYSKMKNVAESNARLKFSYMQIAKKAILMN